MSLFETKWSAYNTSLVGVFHQIPHFKRFFPLISKGAFSTRSYKWLFATLLKSFLLLLSKKLCIFLEIQFATIAFNYLTFLPFPFPAPPKKKITAIGIRDEEQETYFVLCFCFICMDYISFFPFFFCNKGVLKLATKFTTHISYSLVLMNR